MARRIATYSLTSGTGRSIRWPYQPSTTGRWDTPRPRFSRPPDSSSIVAAVIAVIAALRPGIWKIAEPSLIVVVPAASHARTVAASEP